MTLATGSVVRLPLPEGGTEPFTPRPAAALPEPDWTPPRSRSVLAAAHVVADPCAPGDPGFEPRIDWERTMAFRHHLWSYGFGVADAMDTAQRGGALDWPLARELIQRSAREARATGGRLACGAMTDQLDAGERDLDRIRGAYEEQCEAIDGEGATPVLMASRQLAAAARSPEDYRRVLDPVISGSSRPVILHWLGTAFDPLLEGYWGAASPAAAIEHVAALIADHAERIEGIKVSLLDASLEVELRRRMPEGVRVFTGDDFNFPELIRGDGERWSDGLLGIFDAIAPVAAAALEALDEGDEETYSRLLEPCVPFSRHVFAAPTQNYKTGVVFLAYLNGHQDHFRMVGGMESARSIVHLAELFRLADIAHVLTDPEQAVRRFRPLLQLAGIDQA